MTELRVRIAGAVGEDPEWCANLMSQSEPWVTLQRTLESSREVLRRPGTELFVARLESEDVRLGFVLLAPYGLAGSPYISAIGVSAEAQGKGVGSQLLAFTERLYLGRRHLLLLVSSFNTRAQQFYRRHGFAQVGELEDYIVPGHSELIFHKTL